jgi:hypothetical protein
VVIGREREREDGEQGQVGGKEEGVGGGEERR